MPKTTYIRPTCSLPPPMNPLLAAQPPIARLTPPVYVVDLMTRNGSAVFGATQRGIEARLVECAGLSGAMPEFKRPYDAAGCGFAMTASRAAP